MTPARDWQDLMPRILSGILMIAIGALEIWLGGWPFRLFVCLICGVMIWEVSRMFAAPRPKADGVLAGFITLVVSVPLPWPFVFPLVLAAAFVTAGQIGRDRRFFFISYTWIVISCLALIHLRDQFGLIMISWLICIVVATDIAGYFAGRIFGGPKFWPSVSPKKTWSGTLAGWSAAAGVGLGFMALTGRGWLLIPASIGISFASQLGDITESAIKRRMGVKDSSNLIPGHGGVLDRFDGLMGGAVVLLLALLWAGWAA